MSREAGVEGDFFSCEGAAQQVHLSLCLSVCPSGCLKTELFPVLSLFDLLYTTVNSGVNY